MKTLLVLSAAVAAVSAEADPQFLYHGYAPAAYYNPFLFPTLKKEPKMEMKEEEMAEVKTPLVYSPYLHHPYAFNYGYGYPYAAYPYHTYAPYVPVAKAAEEKKVEKREADPTVRWVYNYQHPVTYTHTAPLTTYTYPVAHHLPLVYTAATGCQNHMGAAVPCAYGNVVAPVAAPVEEKKEVEKREAEADPEAWWYGNYYNAYNYHYYPYNHYSAYYAPYHYAVGGCRNNFGAVVPCA